MLKLANRMQRLNRSIACCLFAAMIILTCKNEAVATVQNKYKTLMKSGSFGLIAYKDDNPFDDTPSIRCFISSSPPLRISLVAPRFSLVTPYKATEVYNFIAKKAWFALKLQVRYRLRFDKGEIKSLSHQLKRTEQKVIPKYAFDDPVIPKGINEWFFAQLGKSQKLYIEWSFIGPKFVSSMVLEEKHYYNFRTEYDVSDLDKFIVRARAECD